MVLPDLFEQHRARDKPALRAHQEFEQPEFARLKVDRLSAAAHGAGDEIHFEIAGLEQGLRSSQGRTAGERGEARHQFLEGEGLDEIVVAARLESVDPIVDAGEVGEKEHRRRDAVPAHQRDDAEAVQFRQHAVEHDDVEAVGACALIAFATVARDRRLMSSRTEARRDELGGSLVVLDHQNLHAADLAERRDGQAIRRAPGAIGQAAFGSQIRQPQSRPMSPETAIQADGATNSLHAPQRCPSCAIVW